MYTRDVDGSSVVLNGGVSNGVGIVVIVLVNMVSSRRVFGLMLVVVLVLLMLVLLMLVVWIISLVLDVVLSYCVCVFTPLIRCSVNIHRKSRRHFGIYVKRFRQNTNID